MVENKIKNITFYINDDKHARLRVQLKYDDLTQTRFINFLIDGYMNHDPLIREFINNCKIQHNTKRKKKNRLKDYKERNKTIEDYALNDEEIKNIFDIIESENPDL